MKHIVVVSVTKNATEPNQTEPKSDYIFLGFGSIIAILPMDGDGHLGVPA
jgi:hypothetical protein